MKIADFSRSYFRFYLDFENQQIRSISRKSPVKANRVRVTLESICQLTHRPSERTTIYALSAPCRTEQVGAGKNELWMQPNAECIFLCADDGQAAVYKTWHKKDPGVMLYPESLGPQPERQSFAPGENFLEVGINLSWIEARQLGDYNKVADAIVGVDPIVSRIAYSEGDFDVIIDQPVKTINLCERDQLHQTDTGPIILPNLSSERLEQAEREIEVFDLAFSAWHAPDWAEFLIQKPLALSEEISINHYAETRHISSTQNSLFTVS